MYIQLVGYPKYPESQGLIKEDPDVYYEFCELIDLVKMDGKPHWAYPVAACFPGVNVIMGLWHMGVALFSDPEYEHVPSAELAKYRAIKFLVGLAELTLIGGWIVHGGATAYFWTSKPDQKTGV
jgi:hypothetical protein